MSCSVPAAPLVPPPNEARRYLMVDALRGCAAMGVVLYHVWHKNLSPELHLELPEPLETIASNGNLGVPIFFVLSGFVIAHSVFGARVTPGFFGRFVLRRSVRLDPPYWASIALAIGILSITNVLRHGGSVALPTVGDVAVHMVYLQEFLGVPEIIPVYWTLCYEVQFYLVFVLLQGLAQTLSRGASLTKVNAAYVVVFGIVWVLSILTSTEYLESPPGCFIDRWFHFFAGVCAYWAYRGFIPAWALAGVLIGTVAMASTPEPVRVAWVAIIAALLYAASQSGQLWTASGGPVLQMLGRVSYSLYLTHMLVGGRIARIGIERYPSLQLGPAVLIMLAATVASVAFAQLMYWAVERPAIRLTHRIRLLPSKTQRMPA
jgi:peptidoglycan/LPS O-acetylase OafA/YrhL